MKKDNKYLILHATAQIMESGVGAYAWIHAYKALGKLNM